MTRFTALIPARLASTRLPQKPLADLGGLPMVVRVARQAQRAGAQRTVVAADDPQIVTACLAHGVEALLTRTDHVNGSDRLAQACELLGLDGDACVVNVQGDEPLIDPALIAACADCLDQAPDAVMATAAHPITQVSEWFNPHVVKVVLDARQRALLFSRAPLPWWRDGLNGPVSERTLPEQPPILRHIGLYAYRARFLRQYPHLPVSPLETLESLEQLRVLWHGLSIAVHVTASAPEGGVDTPEDLQRVRAVLAQASAGCP